MCTFTPHTCFDFYTTRCIFLNKFNQYINNNRVQNKNLREKQTIKQTNTQKQQNTYINVLSIPINYE